MKLLHVISSGGLYGAEAVILALCQEFTGMGHECAIASFDNKHLPNRQLADAAESRGIHVHSVPCQGQFDLSAVQRLSAILVSGEYDVCHSHGFKSDAYLYLAANKRNPALVATCHGWIENDLRVKLYGVFDRFILRWFDQVVSVSANVTRRLIAAGVLGEKISFIRNGVNITRFAHRKRSLRNELGIGSEDVLVGTVGRLSPEKGLQHLLSAAKLVRADNPNLRIAIVGDGPERDALERFAADLKVNDIVHFLGRRSDTPEVFASLDILVQPSLSEGLPITLLEAIASGCAVVATAVGTVPEVLEDGVDGVLIPPADSQRLADAISLLVNDGQVRHRLASAAQERAVMFSSERMAQAYLDVYAKALQKNSCEMSAGR